MNQKNNYLNIVGLAFRARKCTLGEETIVKEIQKQRAKLILIANDIGINSKKKITDKCKTYEIPYRIVDDRLTLSNAIGKEGRVAVAIMDDGFAKKIMSLLG